MAIADYIYCGTQPPVDADGTQKLLREHGAIWCPPGLSVEPSEGDRMWLVWRASNDAIPVVLGGGRVMAVEGKVFWTERTLPGIRSAAEAVGYGSLPTNMRFLRLTGTGEFYGQPPIDLSGISSGLNVASPEQVKALEKIVGIL